MIRQESFVTGIGRDENNAVIVNAINAMARSLRLRIGAEGVETADQAAFHQARRCLAAQGNYFGKEVTAEEFIERLCR